MWNSNNELEKFRLYILKYVNCDVHVHVALLIYIFLEFSNILP